MASAAKKSPELIQLLELHAQFAAITPYQVGLDKIRVLTFLINQAVFHNAEKLEETAKVEDIMRDGSLTG